MQNLIQFYKDNKIFTLIHLIIYGFLLYSLIKCCIPYESLLTCDNFDATVQPTKVSTQPEETKDEIILYYATWCGYSRMILPEWEKFVTYSKENFPTVRVTSLKCEGGDEASCTQKGVQGYPTVIMYLKDGTEIPFKEERLYKKLIEFVEKNKS